MADVAINTVTNAISGDEDWVSDSIFDAGVSVTIYALSGIPCVGWALSLGATVLVNKYADEIEQIKNDFADGWNYFWSFKWATN